MAIGKRIVERLKQIGWSRNQLMEAVDGLTPQALSNLINRDSRRSEWDEAIASALGVSVIWLVYGRDDAYPAADVRVLNAREPLPDPLDRLLAVAQAMSRDGQLVLLGRAEEMARNYRGQSKTAS